MNKIFSIVLGTRPEIIKMSPIIYELQRRQLPFELIHTGQHYDENMNAVFFRQLNLPPPNVQFHIGGLSRPEQIHRVRVELTQYWRKQRPHLVMIQGDTNTVMATAKAAHDSQIPVAHVEAGLRSFDKAMPEEENRIVADHLADWLFAPTHLQKHLLAAEQITEGVHVVGNTIADMLRLFPPETATKTKNKQFILLTLHRPSNVDDANVLSDILSHLQPVARQQSLPIIWPVHPRTRRILSQLSSIISEDIVHLIEPLGWFEFLQLEKYAQVVITDSGGVQEETCILGTPCVTFRTTTERQETLACGSNHLVKESDRLAETIPLVLASHHRWVSPYYDGTTASTIVSILTREQS